MVQNVVIEAIYGKQIALVVNRVDRPIIAQLFGTQHQHTVVSQLIVFNNGQPLEGFTQTYAVRNDTAVIFFELVDGS